VSRSDWSFLQESLDIDVAEEMASAGMRQIEQRSSLSRMVDLALERGYANGVGDLLDQAANLRQHKLFNDLLTSLQRPHADFLLPAHDWHDRWGRRILPNEHPIVLLVPFAPVGFYFDVSQTEATDSSRKLPLKFENPYRMQYVNDAGNALEALRARVLLDGVRISEGPLGHRYAGHIRRAEGGTQEVPIRVGRRVVIERRPVRFEVTLNRNYTVTEKLATLAHEVGHLYCGHLGAATSDRWPDRAQLDEPTREYEAESVARLVFRRIAPETELPDHLEQFFAPGSPVPDSGWARVVSASDCIIDHCLGGIDKTATALRLRDQQGTAD
jgi:hypothetical protein